MKRHRLIKTAVLLVVGSILVFAGYCAGLLVQYQQGVRVTAYCHIYEAMFAHKQITAGASDITLRRIEGDLDGIVAATHFQTHLSDLLRLLKGGALAHSKFDDDWRDKATASVAGFHRDRPDVVFSKEVQHELDSFVPADEVVRRSIDFYSQYKPREAKAAVKQQEAWEARRSDGKQIWADSYLGKPAPDLHVNAWLTPEPDTKGKFVLVDFWATWCPPCRQTIPELNRLQQRFRDRLVVIGLGGEPQEKIDAMPSEKPNYALAFDGESKTKQAISVTGIPHVLLIDPSGIVRWEGFPLLAGHELTEQAVKDVLDRFGTTAGGVPTGGEVQ